MKESEEEEDKEQEIETALWKLSQKIESLEDKYFQSTLFEDWVGLEKEEPPDQNIEETKKYYNKDIDPDPEERKVKQDRPTHPDPDEWREIKILPARWKITKDINKDPNAEGSKEDKIIPAEGNIREDTNKEPDPEGGKEDKILLEDWNVKREGLKGPEPEDFKEVNTLFSDDGTGKDYRPSDNIGGKAVKRQGRPTYEQNQTKLEKITMTKLPP